MMSIRFSVAQNHAREVLSKHRYSCIFGGTRSGKTFLILRAIIHRALRASNSRHAVLRFRGNAARASIALDTFPVVLQRCFPNLDVVEHRQEGYFQFRNGSQIWIGGLDNQDRVEKILGLEFVTIFLNEASQIPYSSAIIAFTRLAQVVPELRQRAFVDLNPVGKNHWTNKLFIEHRDPVTMVPIRNPEDYGSARLNPIDNAHNLSKDFLDSLDNLPEKQRKRFYEGAFADEIDCALWDYEQIAACRCPIDNIPESDRVSVVVAVDPSGASNSQDMSSDEIGIIVAARGRNGKGFILADRSLRDAPSVWGRIAIQAYHEYHADCIVAESNFGGAMVEAVIRAADPNVPIRMVTASRGKVIRAEPISVLYQRGLIHHAGRFPVLEEQLCHFTTHGYVGTDSPDHADAMIHAMTYLLCSSNDTGIIEFYRRIADKSPFPE
ncbi:phage terminase large subunit [Beijerinckia mobilis]|uniref:phage terminase large subunit n=1 Tax=Beijerinckia mobilis TaxID=231434 RepID=UPI00068B7BD7|nr:phage terminase large subunit [Beijerinckia mobilis]